MRNLPALLEPFTPTISRDVANIGVANQRPNRIADKTAFVVPDAFTYGNSGAGILRSDHQWNVDASLFKKFTAGTGHTLEFRVEAFNLLNSVYFSAPNAQIDTATAGKVTSTSNQPRQMQLGWKSPRSWQNDSNSRSEMVRVIVRSPNVSRSAAARTPR